jgi:hypothetical protein
VHYKENQNVGRTSPIWLNAAYSIGWSGAETETHVFKVAAKFRVKRTSITSLRAKNRAFSVFLPPTTHFSLVLGFPQQLKSLEAK